MASYILDFSNHRVQLLATAIASGVTVASLLLGYQALEREERLSELKSSIPSVADGHKIRRVRELFARKALEYGADTHRSIALAHQKHNRQPTKKMPAT